MTTLATTVLKAARNGNCDAQLALEAAGYHSYFCPVLVAIALDVAGDLFQESSAETHLE